MADKTSIMKEAQKYLAKGQIDKAISEIEKIIKESPDGNIHNTVGDLYIKKGDKKNAIESFHKAANFFRHEGFSLKALALYKKVLNINPSESDALYSLGELSEEKGLTTDAIKYYLATADSMVKEGKKDRVLEIYEKILSLSPANIPLRNKVAEIFLKEGLKTDACKEYIYIARLYDEKNDMQKTREYYQKVIDLQPLNREAILGISYLYEKTGEIQSAIEHTKEASVLFPDDMDIIFRCAELSLLGGNTVSAREYLKKITGKEPSNTKARRLLGEIYLKEGLKEKAWEEYLPVLDELILEEKYEVAIELLESFKDVDPLETGKRLVSLYRQIGETGKVADEFISLGDALLERNMEDEAVSCYRDALEIAPDNELLQKKINDLVRAEEPEAEVTGPEEPFAEGPAVEEHEIEEEGLGLATEQEAAADHISIKGNKTVDEIFTEADIFYRYGLISEAKRLLEGLKLKEPQNIDLHIRLKSVYTDIHDKEAAVTEHLILSELYKRIGDIGNSDKMLKEAFDLDPEDPRLAERLAQPVAETTAQTGTETGERPEPATSPDIEDYEEEIVEAEFYARQGLVQEAIKIFEKLHRIFPDNDDITQKIKNLGRSEDTIEEEDIVETIELSEDALDTGEAEEEKVVQQPGAGEFEDFSFTEKDFDEASEIPEPALDDDVLEIFQEFKRGLEKELDDEDSETHYNLGIAYKEMGLIDDAIKEFQTSRNDPKRFIQSSTMLGVCYIEKGLYSLAIDALQDAIKNISSKDDAFWAIKYDLAEAYEKNNNLKEALEFYTDVFGWNARFRNVSEKVNKVRAQLAKGGEKEKPKERKDRVSYL